MKAIFIAGTDTGAGKTVVTSLLARYLSDRGYKVITQKWVQTGCRRPSAGAGIKPYRRPYVFKYPASPHLSAKLEGKKINVAVIKKSFKFLADNFDFVIVEGTGGVLVPISEKQLLIDIVKELSLPVLLVALNKLGAINHALLTIEALKNRKLKLLGVIFNNAPGPAAIILKDNPRIIKVLSGQKIFGVMLRTKNKVKLYKSFIPIAKNIFNGQLD